MISLLAAAVAIFAAGLTRNIGEHTTSLYIPAISYRHCVPVTIVCYTRLSPAASNNATVRDATLQTRTEAKLRRVHLHSEGNAFDKTEYGDPNLVSRGNAFTCS